MLCGQVREALACLREGDCELLKWYFEEGLSERAIAERMGKSKTWVHNRLTGLIQQLREWLGEGSDSERGKKGKKE